MHVCVALKEASEQHHGTLAICVGTGVARASMSTLFVLDSCASAFELLVYCVSDVAPPTEFHLISFMHYNVGVLGCWVRLCLGLGGRAWVWMAVAFRPFLCCLEASRLRWSKLWVAS